MSAQFVNIDRDTPMLLPPDLRDRIPEDSMVHFIVEAVEGLDIQHFKVNDRWTGSAQYPPRMLLSLLIYCYATGRFSSRVIQQAGWYDVAVRYICGGDRHPDHDTICAFRTGNREAFKEAFGEVLLLAKEMGYLTPLDTGLSLPEELKWREDRKAALARARKIIEERYKEIREQKRKDQFLMRSLENVAIEWDLVMLAYNFKRLHRLEQTRLQSAPLFVG